MPAKNNEESKKIDDTIALGHWIWGSVPKQKGQKGGQGRKAVSSGFNVAICEARLKGHYTPIFTKIHSDKHDVDSRMIHPVNTDEDILLSRLSPGPLDDTGRPTFQNHTVVIPTDLLRSGKLTLEIVDSSLHDFDLKFPEAVGEIDQLQVAPLLEVQELPSQGRGFRHFSTRAAFESLASRMLAEPHNRTLLLYRGSTQKERNTLLYSVIELLNLSCDLPLFAAMSDRPYQSALNSFKLVISARGFRADKTWKLIDVTGEKPSLPRVEGCDHVYNCIAECFSG